MRNLKFDHRWCLHEPAFLLITTVNPPARRRLNSVDFGGRINDARRPAHCCGRNVWLPDPPEW